MHSTRVNAESITARFIIAEAFTLSSELLSLIFGRRDIGYDYESYRCWKARYWSNFKAPHHASMARASFGCNTADSFRRRS